MGKWREGSWPGSDDDDQVPMSCRDRNKHRLQRKTDCWVETHLAQPLPQGMTSQGSCGNGGLFAEGLLKRWQGLEMALRTKDT